MKATTKCLPLFLIVCSIFATSVSGNIQEPEKQHDSDILLEDNEHALDLYQSQVEQEATRVRGNLGWGREYEYRLEAERGYPGAQYYLGLMYGQGKEVPQNFKEALKWFRLAAEQGHAGAQVFAGNMYELGQGAPKDYQEAAKWYRLAAEQGNDLGQSVLGYMYDWGKGVPEDDKEAVKWYLLAAEQGNRLAQYSLGRAYSRGEGVPKDVEKSKKWYRLAADQGSASAQNNLASLLLDDKPSEKDVIDAKRYFELAIENGLKGGYAETSLGWHHFTGMYAPVIPLDYIKAFYWNELGAKAGHTNAHSNMALHHFSGLGTSQSFEKMVHHLILSAELMTNKDWTVTEEPDEWLPYKSLAPANYWVARDLWWKAVSNDDDSYIEKLKLLDVQ